MAFTENQTKDIIAFALTKAWEDDNFKKELLASPIDTIENLTGSRLNFKESIENQVVEPTKSEDFNLYMPSNVATSDLELTEEELELVVGGSEANYTSQEGFITFLKTFLW